MLAITFTICIGKVVYTHDIDSCTFFFTLFGDDMISSNQGEVRGDIINEVPMSVGRLKLE